jgi:cellulose synthase/poly-beta-1,6-N-acetylglucosamine synthase-like glycosyltransferase
MKTLTSRLWNWKLPSLWSWLRWWMASLSLLLVAFALILFSVETGSHDRKVEIGDMRRTIVTMILHVPFLGLLLLQVMGIVERLGFYWRGRKPELQGKMPLDYPTVCVQLPMYNEHSVARRVIEAAAKMRYPKDKFSIQVLDDSTDDDTRRLVEQVCAEVRLWGVDCRVLHRTNRQGYKAGALEAGRLQTDSEFLVIFDADFVPPTDFLLRAIPHFYLEDGTPDTGLALVQAQWGHLNHQESALTLSQSLWVDDHHTLQMAWRSAVWKFVNFTGTAGIWRASAIRAAGGWKATSLVEDCELSFRHLFAGYRTKFVKEIVVPSELPATYTAYKAQQKRWTQGWVQLQRIHLRTLLFDYQTSWLRRLHLIYHMCISWQWLAWMLWTLMLPFLIYDGYWFGAFGESVGVLVYVLPSVAWLSISAVVASLETKHTYHEPLTLANAVKRFGRMVPHIVISAGMLPHQFSAFMEGLFGSLSSEFERTPKAASVNGALGQPKTKKKRYPIKIHVPYVLAEVLFILFQLAWAIVFFRAGLLWSAIAATCLAACVIYVAYFYGDHMGKRCFVIDKDWPSALLGTRDMVELPQSILPARLSTAKWGRSSPKCRGQRARDSQYS